jgi:hypothetical protein
MRPTSTLIDRSRTRSTIIYLFFVWISSHTDVAESFTPPLKSFASSRNELNVYKLPLSRTILLVKTSEHGEETIYNPGDATTEHNPSMFFAKSLENSTKANENEEHSGERLKFGETNLSSEDSNFEVETKTATLPYAKEIAVYISRPQSELIDAGLVLLSSFTVAVGTLPATELPESLATVSFHVQDILSYFFFFGFIIRWYAVGNLSMKYFKKPLPFLDFFASVMPLVLVQGIPIFGATVPAWIASDNSALVNLRLLRILRLQELLVDEETFGKVEETLGIKAGDVRPYQLQLARVLISIFTLCSFATGLIYTAEHEVNPMIPDYFTALYFGLTTLTTVGFGDITPITLPGRLVVMGSILVGVAVIPAQGAELVEALLDFQAERRQKKKMKNTLRTRMEGGFENDPMIDPRISCSSCGRRSHRGDAFFCWSCGEKLWQ